MKIDKQVHNLFLEKGWTLSLTESCTGGFISSLLVHNPDCSLYFLGSVVAYSNESKVKILKVKKKTLKEEGAVSEKTAREMAESALLLFKSDFALSTTGVAGPSGENRGLVHFAVASKKYPIFSWKKKFVGSRASVIKNSSYHALKELFKFLKRL